MSVLEKSINKKNESVVKNIIQSSITPTFLDDDVDAGIPRGIHIRTSSSKDLLGSGDGESLQEVLARKQHETGRL